MKAKNNIIIFLLIFLGLSSCLVKSLHPFYTKSDVEFRPELTGTWMDQDSARWIIEQIEINKFLGKEKGISKSYLVTYKDSDNEGTDSYFIVTHFKLNGVSYLDFEPLIENNIGDNLAAFHFIPSHSVARVEFYGDDNIAFIWYDEVWLNELFEKNRIKISHERVSGSNFIDGEGFVLTASTRELQKFLGKYGAELNIFDLINRDKVLEGRGSNEIFNILESEISSKKDKQAFAGNDLWYINMRKTDAETD